MKLAAKTITRFLLALSATLLAGSAGASVQIIPAAPRYQEPVYVRIDKGVSTCFYAAQVSMEGAVLSVKYQRMSEICGYKYDVELGRFPAGTYTVNVQDEAPLQFTVGASPSSPASTYPGNQPIVNYSGMWWDSFESGWGMSIAQGATNRLFAVWFVYDLPGEPTWYTFVPDKWNQSAGYTDTTGPIYKTTGPYLGNVFNPSLVGVGQVGTGMLRFSNFNTGTFEYSLNGLHGTKRIERMIIE